MKNKIKVAILGATGIVGQRFVQLLENNEWFEIHEVVASERSAGKSYQEATAWRMRTEMPLGVQSKIVKDIHAKLESTILFSALDASIAGEAEEHYRSAGHAVFSNSKNHRTDEDVPLLIPEVNFRHMELIRSQQERYNGGFIVTNPNCSTTILCLGLHPIHEKFGIESLVVTTMQSISGAGIPGVPSLAITANQIPYIVGEEEKIQSEPLKIFNTKDMKISAQCNRVPVIDGHTISVSFTTKKKATPNEIETTLKEYRSPLAKINLPSAPECPILLTGQKDRPQPYLDVERNNGMSITVGRLEECPVLDYRMVILGNNVIRGAAGGSILNAEYYVQTHNLRK